MARGVNKVILVGNLGDDPEVKWTSNDKCVAKLRLATSESWKDKNGDKQERTEWHRCVAFGKTAEILEEYAEKGTSLYIEGRLHYDKYDDKDGITRYTCDVVIDEFRFLGGGSGNKDRSRDRGRDRDDDRPARREERSERKRDPLPAEDGDNKTSKFADDFVDDDIPF